MLQGFGFMESYFCYASVPFTGEWNSIQNDEIKLYSDHFHWLGAYRTNALYSGHIFVRFNDLEDVFT